MENTPSFDTMPKMLAEMMEQMSYMTKELTSMSKRLQNQSKTVPAEGFIDLETACEVVHLKKPTIYKLAQKGLIPHYKPAKELLFRRSELIKWVEDSRRISKMSLEEITQMMTGSVKRKPKRWDG